MYVCAQAEFSPPATELDLNSSAERGDREGEEDERRKKVKQARRTEVKKKLKTCLDKRKKVQNLWLPPWCNVW